MPTVSRILASAAAAAAMATGIVAVDATAANAGWKAARVWPDAGVTVRDCYHPVVHWPPSTDCTKVTLLPKGYIVYIVCQHYGQVIQGDEVWDYVVTDRGEGYAADAWIDTGGLKWIPGMDVCQ